MQDTPCVFMTVGECMVEMAPTGDGTYSRSFAGDTFNTAWYARKLLPENWTVSYCTCAGQDSASDDMISFMQQGGIDTSSIRRLDDRTVGLYLIELKDGERSFSYWRSQSAARKLATNQEWLRSTLSKANVIHFSGISIAILAKDQRHTFLTILTEMRNKGTLISFDPNLRKRLWRDDEELRTAVTAAAQCADIILPSFDEEQEFFGDKTPEDTIARYRELGATTIVVKNGPDEMISWSSKEGHQRAMPPFVKSPVDTTAAGDSFNAGVLNALVSDQPLEAAMTSGADLASKVVQGRGALVALDTES